jgi:hypothetical protein
MILFFTPMLHQLIYGRKAIGEDISSSFGKICAYSIVLHLLCSVFSLVLLILSFSPGNEEAGYKCGSPILIFIFIAVFSTTLLLIVILFQYIFKKSFDKRIVTKE